MPISRDRLDERRDDGDSNIPDCERLTSLRAVRVAAEECASQPPLSTNYEPANIGTGVARRLKLALVRQQRRAEASRHLSTLKSSLSGWCYDHCVSPRLSIQLDLLRLVAAVAVACAHLQPLLLPELPRWIARHGQEAVSIFFVLSGFVIAYATDERNGSWRDYTSARSARLFSVVIPVLVVIIFVDLLGGALYPQWYAAQTFIGDQPSFLTIAQTVLFTNEIWFSHVVIGSAEPFWSLGFEVPYYLLFAIFTFSTGSRRIILCALWAALVGPKILLYLPLWLTGVATWHLVKSERVQIGKLATAASVINLLLIYMFWKQIFGGGARAQFQWESVDQALLTAAYHMVIALLVAALILLQSARTRDQAAYSQAVSRPIRWAAGGSFTLYLLHQPLFAFAAASLTTSAAFYLRVGAVALALVAIYSVAAVGERRKTFYEGHFRRLMNWDAARNPSELTVARVSKASSPHVRTHDQLGSHG